MTRGPSRICSLSRVVAMHPTLASSHLKSASRTVGWVRISTWIPLTDRLTSLACFWMKPSSLPTSDHLSSLCVLKVVSWEPILTSSKRWTYLVKVLAQITSHRKARASSLEESVWAKLCRAPRTTSNSRLVGYKRAARYRPEKKVSTIAKLTHKGWCRQITRG